jgi:acyl-CoA synthetase (NDP forming)
VICVPGGNVLESAAEALRKGVRALCVISAGFAEVGAEGAERQRSFSHSSARTGLASSARIASASQFRLGLNATFAPRALRRDVSRSRLRAGALGLALLEKATERGLGFSSFVSIRNKADVSSNDLLEWWEEDDGTDVVLLYLESFGNPQSSRVRASRPPQADPRSEGGDVRCRRARSKLAHSRAREAPTPSKRSSGAGVLRAGNLEELIDVATLLSASRSRAAGASPC